MTALVLIVGLLFLGSTWAALLTYSLFWYENAWRAGLDPYRGRKLKSMVFWGVLSSISSLVFITASSPLGLIRRLWEPKEIDATGPVIILVHGLYHNPSAWLIFRSRLRRAGLGNIFFMGYRSFFTSFEKIMEEFDKFVGEVRQKVAERPLYLVGHSLGGLLCRVYAERAGDGAVPAAVITLGSPHQGSKVAAFYGGKLASSLLYRGPLFTGLESGPARLRCAGIAFFSPVDNMVLPFEALKVPYEGWAYHETVPMSHTSMVYSRSVARRVIEVIKGC
ncbi:MAG TPA: alpha/beta fold hydrolase [Syntrophobacteraceae bacterium]|nr:alpha/beta fold hydrolase [Syntrophobacteraceae bacterium]